MSEYEGIEKPLLKKKKRYLHYFFRDIVENKIIRNRLKIYFQNTKFAGISIPNYDTTNDIITEKILIGEPFALIRPGTGEFNWAAMWEEEKLFGRLLYKRKNSNNITLKYLLGNRYDEYQKMQRRDYHECDIFACFKDSIIEEYLVETYANNAEVICYNFLTPINAKRPWTDALKGKKVLVISIFADWLKEQYGKRGEIFNGEWSWPEMELIPLKSVFFFGPSERFPTYFDALNYLYEEAMKNDFDIAILSCGFFAIDLAPMFKRAGKQAIQYGGELQMLFGIRGARWDKSSFFSKYYNDSWIRVSKAQTGVSEDDSKTLDDGVCYW